MLNSLLDNKHPDEKGRPALKPGFKLIGTQNGIQLAGRNLESPALKSRSMHIRLPRYTPEEVFSIAVSMGVDAFHASALERAYADTKPSFRQVLNWINNEYTPQEINQEFGFFFGLTPPPVEELAEDFEMEVGDDQSMSVDWSI